MNYSKKLIIIYGPTGVGKTDLALSLDKLNSIEIINGDIGQLYEPLSIGTAKPDWKNEIIPHHLFDYCKTPKNITVVEYRKLILETIESVWDKGSIPVIVGGSGFYIKSLFFPPKENLESINQDVLNKNIEIIDKEHATTEELWKYLYQHDSERALSLATQDRYRITRAIDIVLSGKKPSDLVPDYVPFQAEVLVLFLNRKRDQLYQRINQRTEIMMQQGWIDEVEKILGTEWQDFLLIKKIIGYDDIIKYILYNDGNISYEQLIESIQKKTRNYAKRQCTFWRMLQKKLHSYFLHPSAAIEFDLTEKNSTLVSALKTFLKDNA